MAVLLTLVLMSCGKVEPSDEPPVASPKAVDQRLCSDPAVVSRLRELVIERARRLKPSDAEQIERIGRAADLQIGRAAVAGSDPALDLTLCRAQLGFELPEGAEDAFDGGRLLAAELRYAVQRTAAGAMTVHQIEGAEPLAYRLAAVPLRMAPPRAPVPTASPQRERPPTERLRRRAVASPAAPLPPRRGLEEPALTARGRPSFDCRRAGSRVERMICRDERLAALDRVAVSLYARSLAQADRGTRAGLRQSQARFIERRDDCRRSGCVADRYRARLNEIDALVGR